jgi:hypothetical protein
MGKGQPTSRTPSYTTELEVLLETKNQHIAELQTELREVHCEVGLWLDGDQTPLKTLLNIRKILNVH